MSDGTCENCSEYTYPEPFYKKMCMSDKYWCFDN